MSLQKVTREQSRTARTVREHQGPPSAKVKDIGRRKSGNDGKSLWWSLRQLRPQAHPAVNISQDRMNQSIAHATSLDSNGLVGVSNESVAVCDEGSAGHDTAQGNRRRLRDVPALNMIVACKLRDLPVDWQLTMLRDGDLSASPR